MRSEHKQSIRTRCVIVAAIVMSVVVLGSYGANASDGGSFSVRPAHYDPNDPATRAYFKMPVKPGDTATDQVVVAAGAQPVTLLVYPVDGLTGQTSGSVYGNHGDSLIKAGQWVDVHASTISIPAGSSQAVSFTVHVPSSAAAGDHLAGIAFEKASTQTSGSNFAVKEVIRMVVGIQVIVPGPADPHLTLGSISISKLGGTSLASVIIGIGNNGTRLCKPDLSVSVRNQAGSMQTSSKALDTILPGDTINYPYAWPNTLTPGVYTIDVAASCGGVRVTTTGTASLGVTLPGTQTVQSSSRSQQDHGVSGLMFVFVGVAGIALGALASRKRNGNRSPQGEVAPDQQAADDAKSLVSSSKR